MSIINNISTRNLDTTIHKAKKVSYESVLQYMVSGKPRVHMLGSVV